MATAKQLLSLLGKPTKSATLRKLMAADQLKTSKEPDLEEGAPATCHFVGKKAGYEISAEDGTVVAVFLYVVKSDGFAAFPGPLPYDVPSESSRAEVRRLLGDPERSGKAHHDKILGPQGAWDRFAVDSVRIHFQYTDPELRIYRITVMTEESAP
jgi:hypothetical protein